MLSSIDTPDSAITYATARGDEWVTEDSPAGGGVLNGGRSRDGLPRLSTFGAGDSVTVTRRLQASKAFTETTWDAPRVVAFVVDVSPLPEIDTDPEPPKTLDETVCYFATGNPAGGVDGFGFKIEGGTLCGVTYDGTAEQTHELSGRAGSVPDRGPMRLRASTWGDKGAGGPVRFFRGGTQVGQSEGAVPDGDDGTAHEILWSASLENQTGGDEVREFDVDASVLQKEA